MGRRPVKVKVRRLPSRVFDLVLGFKSRVDVVAQQVLDFHDGIFKAVHTNDVAHAMALAHADDGHCLSQRDSAGASPVHVAFLYGHHELGKQLVLRRRDLATLTYSLLDASDGHELSPYEGENILHIAIVQRSPSLCKWLLTNVPELIHAEAVGKFFRPGKACYFGGTPLLFALASNQIDIALDILEAAEALRKLPKSTVKEAAKQKKKQQLALLMQLDPKQFAIAAAKQVQKVLPVSASSFMEAVTGRDEDDAEGDGEMDDTAIFMADSFGNNALHLAVLHDLPNVFDFALQFAMHVLETPDFSLAAMNLSTDDSKSDVQPLPEQDQEVLDKTRCRSRLAAFSAKNASLVEFLRRVDAMTHEKLLHGFIMHRNRDDLTPLSLAAAIGNSNMFQHILKRLTAVSWTYGPISALNIPLLDLEEPVPMPKVHHGRLEVLYQLMSSLPYPLAPKGQKGYKTAIQCLCSLEKLSMTIPKAELSKVLENRLEMLQLIEVRQILAKKWKYVGKKRFRARLLLYTLFLVTFNVSTLFQTGAYSDAKTPAWQRVLLAICECISYGFTIVKFLNESHQMLFNFRSYITEEGAGRLDNVCTTMASLFLFGAGFARLAGHEELNDAFTAVALVFTWFYQLFFLLGFRTTGPFVIMILNMIRNDIVRFIFVYASIMAGFSQALYLVADGRVGITTLLHRVRMLVIAGFTGEVNYDDNYTSGRMNGFTQVLMLGYIILVMILLVNLLIAMMGNTYAEVLAKSEQRWVAERANIMSTIENQCSAERNRDARRRYAIPIFTREDKEELFLQLEINNIDTWKRQEDEQAK